MDTSKRTKKVRVTFSRGIILARVFATQGKKAILLLNYLNLQTTNGENLTFSFIIYILRNTHQKAVS